MKKLLFIALILICFLPAFAQKTDTLRTTIQKEAEALGHGGNNELKFNLAMAIAGMPEISYERLLEDNMGLGVSVMAGLDKDSEYNFSLTPHFRLYFGQKKANGFFIEGNATVVDFSDRSMDYITLKDDIRYKSYTKFGFGAAAGAKFLTRNGFLGEIYMGASRLFGVSSASSYEVISRAGITIGKRF
ncbi:hypothetical protein FQZ97_1076980 [compost metagenome]